MLFEMVIAGLAITAINVGIFLGNLKVLTEMYKEQTIRRRYENSKLDNKQ